MHLHDHVFFVKIYVCGSYIASRSSHITLLGMEIDLSELIIKIAKKNKIT
jgi:hypothetical protein